MPRVNSSVASRNRRKKIINLAKGYWGGKSKLIRTAKDAVRKSLSYAYRDRRARKRDFRRLWITRIGIAAKEEGIS
ncbi:MAG: 50S ribosomal protein L20, partial [Candidatus Atribacteria bacterium]|nr:50S ribosomal protein L20 [Candidatus Atribacteria bacterium]